jgi:hypothetical protein
MWEAEIKRIMVPGLLGKKSLHDPISTEERQACEWNMLVIPTMAGSLK